MASLRTGMPSAWTRLACAQCSRAFSTSAALASGHNRWSKIRHQKGAADAKKNALRNSFTRTITLHSQMYGADPSMNSQLASTITAAKKAGVPKTTIESAIARGQGRSTSGGKLESMTYEIMLGTVPPVALIVDIETDNRARATSELNPIVRHNGGNSNKSTKFLFTRRGRVVLGKASEEEGGETSSTAADVTADDILDDAIEAGAEDVEDDEDDGNIIVWTLPNQTAAIVNSVPAKHGLSVISAETIWESNEDTQAAVDTAADAKRIIDIASALRNYPDVRAIYTNASQGSVSDEDWEKVGQELDF